MVLSHRAAEGATMLAGGRGEMGRGHVEARCQRSALLYVTARWESVRDKQPGVGEGLGVLVNSSLSPQVKELPRFPHPRCRAVGTSSPEERG